MTLRSRTLGAALALLGAVGCGGGTGEPDAGSATDAGSVAADGGQTTSDAGTVHADAGTASDAGASTDAGATPDAGASTDAGTTSDAGSSTDAGMTSDAGSLPQFSFFVTSLTALRALSGNQNGFGGDLSYGEKGPGAGLRGADKICAAIAERSLPGAGAKPWRAFLSAVSGENGAQVDAIDRIGNGPWYDRLGRLLAPTKADLLHDRPSNGSALIRNDFPNEDGVPNHRPDPNQPSVDNHDILTGSNNQGRLYSATGTCNSWTGKAGTEGRPRVGHSWPRGNTGPMANWMSSLDESGCAPGVNLVEMGGPLPGSNTVGSGGGYGGFYCFALVP